MVTAVAVMSKPDIAPLRADSFVRGGKQLRAGRSGSRKMARRPATARAILNGRARRSEDDKPERHFSGLRSSFQTRMNESAHYRCVLAAEDRFEYGNFACQSAKHCE
jgi:cysteine sulfinate desulfinase/cysteine desulfurase-like protein